jgi:hypothetical protein
LSIFTSRKSNKDKIFGQGELGAITDFFKSQLLSNKIFAILP